MSICKGPLTAPRSKGALPLSFFFFFLKHPNIAKNKSLVLTQSKHHFGILQTQVLQFTAASNYTILLSLHLEVEVLLMYMEIIVLAGITPEWPGNTAR